MAETMAEENARLRAENSRLLLATTSSKTSSDASSDGGSGHRRRGRAAAAEQPSRLQPATAEELREARVERSVAALHTAAPLALRHRDVETAEEEVIQWVVTAVYVATLCCDYNLRLSFCRQYCEMTALVTIQEEAASSRMRRLRQEEAQAEEEEEDMEAEAELRAEEAMRIAMEVRRPPGCLPVATSMPSCPRVSSWQSLKPNTTRGTDVARVCSGGVIFFNGIVLIHPDRGVSPCPAPRTGWFH